MRLELREFNHRKFLIFLPQDKVEEMALDLLAKVNKRDTTTMDASCAVTGTYQTDDTFMPYLRFEVPK